MSIADQPSLRFFTLDLASARNCHSSKRVRPTRRNEIGRTRSNGVESCKSLTVIVELACFESRVQVSKPGSGCPGFSRPFLLHSALSVSGVQFSLITRPERSRDSTCSIDTARAFTGVASCLEILHRWITDGYHFA